LFFAIFLYYTFQIAKTNEFVDEQIKKQPVRKSLLLITSGIAGLYFGGNYFIEGAVDIASFLGMSDSLIRLTIIAVGTSLPELATSVVAAYKKNSDIAVGNVVCSNILNVFLILGLTATLKPLPLNAVVNIDIAVALAASLLLFISTFLFHKRKITRTEGFIFISFYFLYLFYLIKFQ
jgi:cation:H+ antiporter